VLTAFDGVTPAVRGDGSVAVEPLLTSASVLEAATNLVLHESQPPECPSPIHRETPPYSRIISKSEMGDREEANKRILDYSEIEVYSAA
jgi:hypothetical protein